MKSATTPFAEIGYFKTAKLLKIEKVGSENAYVLEVSKNKKAFYSTKTGLKLKEVTTQKLPNGKEMSQAVSFSDYKAVNGILIPNNRNMNFGPQTIKFKLISAKLNEGVTKEDFK